MDLGIKGRVALVAASSTGIGRATAQALAQEGCRVAMLARGRDVLEAAAREIARQTGAEVMAVPGDVTVPSEIERAVAEVSGRFGPIEILLNNAGGPRAGGFEQVETADWEAAFALNLRSAVHFTRAVLPAMKERRWGRIVNLTSVSVKQPVDGLILSNSLRAAVAGFSKSLANEYGPWNILVNTVCPGYTRTDRLTELAVLRAGRQGVMPEEVLRSMAQATPLNRIASPDEIAAAVTFLCSEKASYITGAVLAVDGGLSRGLL